MAPRLPKKRRSWLLVPAAKSDQIAQAARTSADVIVLDLVELIAAENKTAAREKFNAALAAAGTGGAQVFAQIDPQFLYDDLYASAWPGLAGVIASRVETVHQIEKLDALLGRLENERGISSGALEIVAALETAQGNHNAYDMARASSRIYGITLGRADLIMDLRPEPSGELHLMPYLMQRLITIACATKVAPIGAWWRAPDRGLLATSDNTYQAALRGRAIGFTGSMCLRADQVEALNRGYTPSADEVSAARRLLASYETVLAQGQAAAWNNDAFIDAGLARQARRVVALTNAYGSGK